MSIAANFRKWPQALALQLPLPFPRRLVWHTSRPGARWARALRAVRAKLAAARPRVVYPVKAVFAPKVQEKRRMLNRSVFELAGFDWMWLTAAPKR